MMCAERVQKIVQAMLLGFIMGLAGLGMAGDTLMLQVAFIMMFAMMVMLFIAGLTGFCPGLIVLKKIFPPCKCEENSEKDNS
jgi:Mg/Co/Ni transporter MgtE